MNMAPPLLLVHEAIEAARFVASTHHLWIGHLWWMGWNLVLAIVPLSLALVLFRPGTERTFLWATGVVAFVLFLPNAPYVITDVVHLFDDIRRVDSDLQVLGFYMPLYLVFFLFGFGSYVASLELARRHTRPVAAGLRWAAVELAIHFLCAIGLYLGRVVRLNSWDVFTRPRAVVEGVSWLGGLVPAALVVSIALVLLGLTLVVRCVGFGAAGAIRTLPHLRAAT
jgi:uncharacterized membrane protein